MSVIRQVVQLESEASISKSITIPFEFTNKGSIPQNKTIGDSIVITPMTVRTWFRLKPYLMSIDKDDRERIIAKKDVIEPDNEIMDLIGKYDEILFEIVCIGINNKGEDMPEWFKNVLKDNCTWEDIYILLNAVFFRLNHNPFFDSITVLEAVSPLDEEEIIALQKNNETWNRKATSCSSQSATKS